MVPISLDRPAPTGRAAFPRGRGAVGGLREERLPARRVDRFWRQQTDRPSDPPDHEEERLPVDLRWSALSLSRSHTCHVVDQDVSACR
jgi:hypothetical protein